MSRLPKTGGMPWIVVLSLLAMSQARATIIELSATGEVTEITNAVLSTQFSVGQTMSAVLRYDLGTPPVPSLVPTQALYPNAIVGGSFSVGAYSGAIGAGNININDDDPTFADTITFRAAAVGAAVGTFDPRLFGLRFEDLTAAALSSRALPGAGADLSGLAQSWALTFGAGLDSAAPGIFGRLVRLDLRAVETVPEPGVGFLLLTGIAATAMFRRARTRHPARTSFASPHLETAP
ncbi:MAG: PEP-CTERM sorting domain-containing protein [Gammaproteobacteria bacterium]